MMHIRQTLVIACWLVLSIGSNSLRTAEPAKSFTGPWDLAALKRVPEATWGKKEGLVQEVYYAGEPWKGKPTRVFGYYARPAEGAGPFPAMVLVHGGGGKAFAEWATLWAERGYCALAMDTAGCGPDQKRLPDCGPPQSNEEKFRNFTDDEARDVWTYHAVADAILAHSLLASRPEVDPKRIGITGISWGGYLTCITAGLDDRLKVAVPVYGCGFLGDNSTWLKNFAAMEPKQRERWLNTFDPSRYLPGVRCPILFVNGTNDFAYPLDSYRKSYRQVPGPIDLCVRVEMPHGHPQGWAPVEIGLYADSVLKQGKPLARLQSTATKEGVVSADFTAVVPLKSAELHYTSDTGEWPKRKWHTTPAKLTDGHVEAELPKERPLLYYLSVTDEREALVSTPHEELP